MQIEDRRGADAEWTTAPHDVIDQVENPVELRDGIFGFATRLFERIGDQRGFFGRTVSIIAQA